MRKLQKRDNEEVTKPTRFYLSYVSHVLQRHTNSYHAQSNTQTHPSIAQMYPRPTHIHTHIHQRIFTFIHAFPRSLMASPFYSGLIEVHPRVPTSLHPHPHPFAHTHIRPSPPTHLIEYSRRTASICLLVALSFQTICATILAMFFLRAGNKQNEAIVRTRFDCL